MNFATVDNITIPEGNVKSIYSNGVKIWGKPNKVSGALPLTLENCTKDTAKYWVIEGDTYQDLSETATAPAYIWGSGKWDSTAKAGYIPITSGGKNLNQFPFTTPYYVTGSGQNRTVKQASFGNLSNIISLKPNTTYVLSGYRKDYTRNRYGRIALFDTEISVGITSTRFFSYTDDSYVKFTTSDTEIYGMIFINNTDEPDCHEQLEEGTVQTPYEPYHEPVTTNIPINDNYFLYKGDTVTSDGKCIRKNRMYQFTGNETFSISGQNQNIATCVIPDVKPSLTNIQGNAYCTHFICRTYNEIYHNSKFGFAVRAGGYGNGLAFSMWSDLADFKSFLKQQAAAGTPVMVLYEMVEPITTDITVPDIPLYEGTTIIDSTLNDKTNITDTSYGIKPTIKISYK